jgi:CheY-like chemotaxis protein
MRSVLIVDDDIMLRETFSLLIGEEFNVIAAGTPEEAFDALDGEQSLHALIVDFDLQSDLDGTDVALRARQKHPHMPIIMASGNCENSSRLERFKAIPNTALLTKPFSHSVLEGILETGVCSTRQRPT